MLHHHSVANRDFISSNQLVIQEILEASLPISTQNPQRLHQCMRYAVLMGGKRIRPLLVYAVGQSFGAKQEVLNIPAAAVELMHCYSLIHDDLPAMDNDDLRRGQPTCHKQFDEATAILAGDALQCLAFSILARDTKNSAKQVLQMINLLGQACGSFGMAGGQMIDLQAMGQALSLAELQTMHRLKTGALIKCSILLGAIAARVDTTTFNNLSEFAEHLGLAFQIQDDILDVEGDTQVLGKHAGADALLNKPTYPAIEGMAAAKLHMEKEYQSAMNCLKEYGSEVDSLHEVAAYLVNRNY